MSTPTPYLDAIGIVSRDLLESVRFYRLLGLDFPVDPAGEDHLEAKTPSGVRVMLDALELVRKLVPNYETPRGHRMGLAFHCGEPKGVDATYAQIVAAGFESKLAPWDAFWGQRYAQVIDPDGNIVDLFAPLPPTPEGVASDIARAGV